MRSGRGTDLAEAGATAALRHEHDLMLRGLTLLERAGRQMAAGHRTNRSAWSQLIELLRTLADRCHHVKEEDHLFPAMRAKDIPTQGPIAAILAQHGEGQDYLAALAELSTRAERIAAALLYARLLREHIKTENTSIFPLADAIFSPAEHRALAARYEEVDRQFGGPAFHPALERRLATLEAAFPPCPTRHDA